MPKLACSTWDHHSPYVWCLQTASRNMEGFFRNWLWWVRRAGVTNVVVGVSDEASAQLVLGLGVTCINMTSDLLPPGDEIPGEHNRMD